MSADGVIVRIKHHVDSLKMTKSLKVMHEQTVGEVKDILCLKHLRGNPDAILHDVGLTRENGEWLPEDCRIGQLGIAHDELFVFRRRNEDIVVVLPDDSTHKVNTNISMPMSDIISEILRKIGFSLLTAADARTSSTDWFDLSKPTYELIDFDKEALILGLRPNLGSYISANVSIESVAPYETTVLYIQALKWVLDGALQVSYEDAVNLAAWQCQVEFGDYSPREHIVGSLRLDDFFSPLWSKSLIIEADVYKRYKKLTGKNKCAAQKAYIRACIDCHPYLISYFVGKVVFTGDLQIHQIISKVSYDSDGRHVKLKRFFL
eukprot:TRINITY_DN2915_c0_g3_i1.p1 TRINITY_DN2915_c0_g3~~TRINITY_DN2915_c0_g3_i1.p1  ORF type:complete len:320 (-),score=64.96 TRINITY_DN2915_c0_g3_i1:23-982(-)